MTMFRNFARRFSTSPHPPAPSPFHREGEMSNGTGTRLSPPLRKMAAWISIALLCCLSAGCARRVTYVNSDHKLVRLEAGQPAPNSGVLMSEGYLSEIFEALGKKE